MARDGERERDRQRQSMHEIFLFVPESVVTALLPALFSAEALCSTCPMMIRKI
jgi:hypothetical protein